MRLTSVLWEVSSWFVVRGVLKEVADDAGRARPNGLERELMQLCLEVCLKIIFSGM